MTTTTTELWLNNNGRCTCIDHAGGYLTAAIKKNPNAGMVSTAIETWAKIDVETATEWEIGCEECN